MALTFNGIDVRLTADKIPYNFTLPSVTTFSDFIYRCDHTEVVLESAVTASTPSAEFQNLLDTLTTQIQADINTDFAVSTRTVEAYTELTNIVRNTDEGDEFYGGGVSNYICSLTHYVKTSTL